MITVNSKVKDIVECPEAVEIVTGIWDGFDVTNPQMKLAYSMTLRALLAFPATKCPKDKQAAIAAALEEAEIE
ncbi:MAG: hypothetical protein Q4D39_02800 [Coriobacteriaceae bacterium]|nr:hypothetical protein [Coriobacteriaceae bacterium]